jgi:DNA-binding transcriptional MerR regulator
VSASAKFLQPSDAARQLGISAKALRLYEERGLIAPVRTAAGWRTYGPNEMSRAGEVVALRALGFSLTQVARVLDGESDGLERALAAHQGTLEVQLRQISDTVGRLRQVRDDLANGRAPTVGELTRLQTRTGALAVAFDLPWPWGGERFELRDVRALNYIIGPLFSGKTRLALRLAEALPNAAFIGLERLADGGAASRATLERDAALKSRVDQALAWLVDDGATPSEALIALLVGLEVEGPAFLVIDMIEQGLDEASQQALISYLRRRGAMARPLFFLTRSCAILDLTAVGAHEAIILCPANHSPPIHVAAHPGAPGFEAVATCLASPEVRARTEGVIAWRPPVAGGY